MRRADFEIETRHLAPADSEATPPLPTLALSYDSEDDHLQERLSETGGAPLGDGDIDVSVRLMDTVKPEEATAILAISNRLTGEFICEGVVAAETVLDFLEAVSARAEHVEGDPRYRIQLREGSTPVRTFETGALLVYTKEGGLEESTSLIPGEAHP